MATKKRKAGSSSKSRKQYRRPSKGPVTLEEFLDGQRKINGSFYEALDQIIEFLGIAIKSKGDPLAATKKLVEDVPGIDPPGCLPPGGK